MGLPLAPMPASGTRAGLRRIRDAAIRIGGPVGVTADTVEIVYDTGPDDARSWDALPTCDDQPITALADRIRVRITLPFDPLIGILPDITVTNTSHRTIIRDVELGGNPPATAGEYLHSRTSQYSHPHGDTHGNRHQHPTPTPTARRKFGRM